MNLSSAPTPPTSGLPGNALVALSLLAAFGCGAQGAWAQTATATPAPVAPAPAVAPAAPAANVPTTIVAPAPDPKVAPALAPVKDRMTDQIIRRDLSALRAMQGRLENVNKGGIAIDNYHFAKAQRWLDFSVDAYAENDRSGVMQEALTESHALVLGMEQKSTTLPSDTKLTTTSERLREDLWEQASRLKQATGFRCSQGALAKLEVQLVWAGHERRALGWRHAKPYLQAAERYAREAQTLNDTCAPLVANAAPPPPAKPTPEVVRQLEVLADRVHFSYNKSNLAKESATVLDRIASILRQYPGVQVDLMGHADQRGSEQYNLKLSRNRAEAVKLYLNAAGVPSTRLNVKALGKSQLEVNATTAEAYAKNRRVVFVLTMGDGVQLKSQGGDLQMEPEKKSGKGKAKSR